MSTSFDFRPLLSIPHNNVEYEALPVKKPKVIDAHGERILCVEKEVLTQLAEEGFRLVSHFLRTAHLEQLSDILKDPEASDNDKFVALDLLKNAAIASQGVFPSCQDTGTAVIMGKKGQFVWTDMNDEESLSLGVYNAYTKLNLRYSQMAPLDMYKEVNTKCNLPAQIEIYTVPGNEYHFLMIAKGGGSANKSYLYQETAALLNPESLKKFITEKVKSLGTAACPPYHLALVVGGTSAEFTLKCVKLASCKYLDGLPTVADGTGSAYRDVEMEKIVLQIARETSIGAQFGGKYLCHDVRVIRLPRHGASCPVGLGVSCSADRQINCKITPDGVFVEKLEAYPSRFLPSGPGLTLKPAVQVDLSKPMRDILRELTQYPIQTRLSLTGVMVVARDLAHAKLKERLTSDGNLPDYIKDHPVYYAGPAKQPPGHPSGSFGPTTAGRMDSYVDLFQQQGASLIMVAKGNRSKQVTEACKKHGGFYLGSIGGPAARLAQDCIKKVEVLEFPELGMEAVWRIEVVDFPAFIIVDDKGNDFFETIAKNATSSSSAGAGCSTCPSKDTCLSPKSAPLSPGSAERKTWADATGVRFSCIPTTDAGIRRLFDRLDADNKKFLQRNDIRMFIQSIEWFGLEPSQVAVETLLANCGVEGEDKVTYEEFALLCLKLSRR